MLCSRGQKFSFHSGVIIPLRTQLLAQVCRQILPIPSAVFPQGEVPHHSEFATPESISQNYSAGQQTMDFCRDFCLMVTCHTPSSGSSEQTAPAYGKLSTVSSSDQNSLTALSIMKADLSLLGKTSWHASSASHRRTCHPGRCFLLAVLMLVFLSAPAASLSQCFRNCQSQCLYCA